MAAMLVNEPVFVPHYNRLDKGWTPKPFSWDIDLCPTVYLSAGLKHGTRKAHKSGFLMR